MENENIDGNTKAKMLQLIKFWTTKNIKCVFIVVKNWFLTIEAYELICVYLIGASDEKKHIKHTTFVQTRETKEPIHSANEWWIVQMNTKYKTQFTLAIYSVRNRDNPHIDKPKPNVCFRKRCKHICNTFSKKNGSSPSPSFLKDEAELNV